MKRREFVFGGTAAFGAAQLPFLISKGRADVPQRLIDAHCHVFNADDLPVVGFVEKVVVNEHPDFIKAFQNFPYAAHFYVRFLGDWLQKKAPSGQEEIDHLSNPDDARSAARIRDDEIKYVVDLITQLQGLYFAGKNIPVGDLIFGFYAPNVIIGLMHREAFPIVFNGKGAGNTDGAYSPDHWYDPDFLAPYLYDRGKGPVSRYLKWGLRLTRYRSELVDELSRVHDGKARLVTPALIDYSHWLDDKHDVKLAQQVAVMARIARRPGHTRVHGFAPFDPLREAIYRVAPQPEAEEPLALVKRAVGENGFVGVKLYPPMGFKPIGNIRFAVGEFPKHIRDTFKKKNIGGELDHVLTDLFTWCAAEQVPILAHASDSNGSAPGYSARANPDYWAAVVDLFPTLRLSLAHFGDFDEAFPNARRPNPQQLVDTWEWKMAKLISAYPNSLIFADMSYFRAAMLAADNQVRRKVVQLFKDTLKAFPLLAKRLMFGSDWVMLGQEERFGGLGDDGRYVDRVDDLLREVALAQGDREAIMFANPSIYLGLDKAQATGGNRVRLRKFYADHNLADGWLDELVV